MYVLHADLFIHKDYQTNCLSLLETTSSVCESRNKVTKRPI